MILLSHSFSTFSQYVSLHLDFVYITLLLRKGNSFHAIMMLGPPTNSKACWLFNSHEYSKEEIDHVWQQRCNCEGPHVILFVFPGLIVICWYGRTNTYYSTELAVVKAQEFNSMDSKRLQTPKLHLYLDCSSICMPGTGIVLVMNCHQRELYEAICFFWDIHKIDVSKYRTSHIDGHFFPPKKLTSEVHWGMYWFKSVPFCWIDLQFVSLRWNLLLVKILNLKYKVFERHSSATKLTLNLQDWKLVVCTWVKMSSKNDDAN